jgi:proteasome accessory factor C
MTHPAASEPADAGSRLRRLLAVLAYLANVQEASIADLALRFGMDRRTLVSELELVACCGLPPYTPDVLLELIVDDEHVVAHGLEALHSPPRLTPDEGFALAASLRAMLAFPGAEKGPLASALEKLEAALGVGRLSVELEVPSHLGEVRDAAAAGEMIEIDYLGAKPGDETLRRVEPFAVVAREGRFYLDAYCHLADDWRRFQIARIRSLRHLGEPVTARTIPASFSSARAFVGGSNTRLVQIAIDEASYVLVDRFAAGPTSTDEAGRVIIPVEVADDYFLGRLLLRIGPGAEVIDPPELAGAGSDVARLALRNYEAAGER